MPTYKRAGGLTEADKELVAKVVLDQPREISQKQINALATALRRSKATIKIAVEQAREDFAESAGRYVEIHKSATEAALTKGDNETALKGAQWAIERISFEGARLTEKEQGGTSGPRVLIGIKVGGVDAPNTAIDIPTVTASSE